jgi:ribosome recycling factor
MMKQASALKARVVKSLRNTAERADHGLNLGDYADIVKRLPVTAATEAVKKALIKELMDAEKHGRTLVRRIQRAADALGRLPLDETIARP